MKLIYRSFLYRVTYFWRSIVRITSVWRQSSEIKSSISSNKKGLFIDCGGNLGQGFTYFSRFYSPDKFNYVVIEPNPNCQNTLRDTILRIVPEHQFTIIEKAASVEYGSCLFYGLTSIEGGQHSEGASIVSEHNTKYYEPNADHAVEVLTFPLGDLINKYSKEYDVIVLKLDVEGAEYSIMPHLFDTGAALKLRHIYIEFHSNDVSIDLQPKRKRAELEIINQLSKMKIGFTRWI